MSRADKKFQKKKERERAVRKKILKKREAAREVDKQFKKEKKLERTVNKGTTFRNASPELKKTLELLQKLDTEAVPRGEKTNLLVVDEASGK